MYTNQSPDMSWKFLYAGFEVTSGWFCQICNHAMWRDMKTEMDVYTKFEQGLCDDSF